MKVISTHIEGVVIIEPEVFGDNRGYFMETYNQNDMREAGLDLVFVQDNQSYTAKKGTLRGIHFQQYPMSQSKLVRVVRGSVMDVAVDLRKDSSTYKQWVAVELSAENMRQLLIPQGFGHAFLTLTDDVEFVYKCDNLYCKDLDRNIRFDDPEIGIEWGIDDPILSDKDASAPYLKDSDCNF